IDKELLKTYDIDFRKYFIMHFFNTGGFEKIGSDNFTLKTRMRVVDDLNKPCQKGLIDINCTDNTIAIYFTNKGCESSIHLYLSGNYISGRNVDLSKFSCDFTKWQDIVVQVLDNELTVFFNGDRIFDGSFHQPAGDIIGLHYLFDCIGEIDYAELYDEGNNLVYEDQF
ncbi:MAG: hypothetical protein PVF73_05525, partial [Bacteroidales bacterium]